jgi:hypothetical protein
VVLLPLLAACDPPARADVRAVTRELAGFGQDARLPPPGLDRPSPNLASVPARPEPPNRAARDAITDGLRAAREASRTPLEPGLAAASPRFAPAPGAPPLPATPPAPPRLATAPAIPWTPVTVPVPEAATPAPELGPVPAAPAPELLAPAAPAAAPPAAPPPALLAPR